MPQLVPFFSLNQVTVVQQYLYICSCIIYIVIFIYLMIKIASLLNRYDAAPRDPTIEDCDNIRRKLALQLASTPYQTVNNRANIYDASWGVIAITPYEHTVIRAKLLSLNRGYYASRNRTHGEVMKKRRNPNATSPDRILRSSVVLITDTSWQ